MKGLKTNATIQGTVADKFQALYTEVEFVFDHTKIFTIHNLLWQIMVNEVHKHKVKALTPVYREGGLEVAIATENESGYNPTGVMFKAGTEYKDAMDICHIINLKAYGWSEDKSIEIITSSMRK